MKKDTPTLGKVIEIDERNGIGYLNSRRLAPKGRGQEARVI